VNSTGLAEVSVETGLRGQGTVEAVTVGKAYRLYKANHVLAFPL